MNTKATASYGYLADKTEVLKRLARIEGQVRGISKMVEDERYCIDILTQLSAVNTALGAVGLNVLDKHVGSCVKQALKSQNPEEAEAKTKELLEAVERFSKMR